MLAGSVQVSTGTKTSLSFQDGPVFTRVHRREGPAATTIGAGDHDCALASLYWAAPGIPENRIVEAFGFCTENWPYGGVTNKEFQIALKYLKAETHYSTDLETLGALLDNRPARCVALLPGHFIAIVNGEIVGRDAHLRWSSSTTLYCHWTFRLYPLFHMGLGALLHARCFRLVYDCCTVLET